KEASESPIPVVDVVLRTPREAAQRDAVAGVRRQREHDGVVPSGRPWKAGDAAVHKSAAGQPGARRKRRLQLPYGFGVVGRLRPDLFAHRHEVVSRARRTTVVSSSTMVPIVRSFMTIESKSCAVISTNSLHTSGWSTAAASTHSAIPSLMPNRTSVGLRSSWL